MERKRAKVTKEELQEKDTRFVVGLCGSPKSVMIMLVKEKINSAH